MNPIQMMDCIQILFLKKIYQLLCFSNAYTYVGGYAQINIYVCICLSEYRELLTENLGIYMISIEFVNYM